LDKLDLLKQEADFFREDLVPNSMEYYLDIMGHDEDFGEGDEECEDDECDDKHKKPKPKKEDKSKDGTTQDTTKTGEEGGDDKKCKNQ